MTAPDPGLTDLIAAALVRSSPNSIDTFDLLPYHRQEAWRVRASEVVSAVEQHTNNRIAELEAELEKYHAEERRELESARNRARDDVRCPSCNLRYGERDQYGCIEPARAHDYDADELRAALEGKS